LSRRRKSGAKAPTPAPQRETPPSPDRAPVLIAVAVALITFVVFLPSLDNDFNYDDDETILRNEHYRGFGAENLRWMFTTFHMGHYHPLTWVSLAADHALWGMSPRGYHTTNLLLHSLSAALVFLIARVMLERLKPPKDGSASINVGAAAAGLLFALHPLRVESVAWITERRDVLSSCLLLACVWMYLRARRFEATGRSRAWLVGAFLVYLASLLSRAMGVTLPIILLVIDWYPLRRIGWDRGWVGLETRRVFIEKLPFFAAALITGIVAIAAQRDVGAAIDVVYLSVAERAAVACYGLVFYLYKSLWPLHLAPFYELKLPVDLASFKYLLSGSIVVALAALVVSLRRKCPGLLVVASCYTVLLIPVLGIFQSGRQEVADRYSYLPAVVLALGLVGCVSKFFDGRRLHLKIAAMALTVTVLLAWWSTLTWQQCEVWHDRVTLWRHATRVVPTSYLAQYNLGCSEGLAGNHTEAIDAFRRCLELNPAYAKALFNMGNSFQMLRRDADALDVYAKAIAANPNDALSYYEMGNVYLRAGRSDDALAAFRKVTQLRQDYPRANVNLGAVLARRGDHAEAIEQFRTAIRLNPDLRDAHYNLAISLEATRKDDEAAREYRTAIQLDPNFPDARVNLANILVRSGLVDEAIEQYRAALRTNPSHPEAKANLDRLLLRLGGTPKPSGQSR
jgi:tetratricopeptide (TPR) repeat protein